MIVNAHAVPRRPPAARNAADRFVECMHEIERAGQALQQALFKRKPEEIWNAVESQETTMQKFAACYKEYSQDKSRRNQAQGAVTTSETDSVIQDLARKIKIVYRTNRALANTFLDVINRTLSGLSALPGGRPVVYDSSGRVGPITTPLLVQQKG